MLQVAPQRARPVDRIESLARHELAGRLGEFDPDVAVLQSTAQLADQEVYNAGDLIERQRLEQHDVVYPVEKLGAKVLPHLTHHGVSSALTDLA